MPVPTITSITPASGHPTGGQLVEVVGTNFQLPPAAPPTGIVPPSPPTVRVLFGGTASGRVAVVSATRLLVVVPKRAMPVSSAGQTLSVSVVDVTVENVDADGVLIPGEAATATGAYTYRRPDASGQAQSSMTLLVRHLVALLRGESVPEVITHQSTDYDSDVSTLVVDSAKLPAVILTGPKIEKNTLFTDNAPWKVQLSAQEFGVQRRPLFNDLTFDVLLITNSDMHLFNLQSLITTVVDRNPRLTLSLGASLGTMSFDLEWVEGLSVANQNAQLASNIRIARGSIKVVGFPFLEIPGTDDDAVRDVGRDLDDAPVLEGSVQIGDNLPSYWGASVRSPAKKEA